MAKYNSDIQRVISVTSRCTSEINDCIKFNTVYYLVILLQNRIILEIDTQLRPPTNKINIIGNTDNKHQCVTVSYNVTYAILSTVAILYFLTPNRKCLNHSRLCLDFINHVSVFH